MIIDYEKKYKEALKKSKEFYILCKKCGAKDTVDFLEDTFSELHESKDEKVRKELISFLQSYDTLLTQKFIAWLEKQGQEPRKVSIWKHWKDGICGNGEGRLIYLIKNGNNYRLSSCLGFECDYIELSDLDDLMLEKQGQKPAEWSHEDDVMVHDILGCLPTKTRPEFNQRRIDWLKSLKERYTWKPSDGQMKALDSVIDEYDGYPEFDSLVSLKNDLKKL